MTDQPELPKKNNQSSAKRSTRRPHAVSPKTVQSKKSKKTDFNFSDVLKKIDFLMVRLKAIPLPYLGGGIAGFFMIIYVVFMAIFYQPVVIEDSLPVEQSSIPSLQPATEGQLAPGELGAESAVPSYIGASGEVPQVEVPQELPIIPKSDDGFKALGREVKMSPEAYDAQSDLYDVDDLNGDQFLGYRVRLPKGWSTLGSSAINEMKLDSRLPGLLVYYNSPPDIELRSSFRIKAQRMAHMMTMRDWVYHYALGNRYTLQAVSDYGDDRVEAVYVVVEMDITYVVRMVAVASGPRVVIGEYFVPMDKYEQEKDLQTWGVTSFYLKKKDLSPAEPTKKLNFFDIASVDYPETWVMKNTNIVSVDFMSASAVNLQRVEYDETSVLRGRIDLFIFSISSNFSDEKIIEIMNDNFENDQIKIEEKIGTFVPVKNGHELEGESFSVYHVNNPQKTFQDYQYWVAVLKGRNYVFYICLLTPPRLSDLYNWSRNMGAFDFMIKMMKEGL